MPLNGYTFVEQDRAAVPRMVFADQKRTRKRRVRAFAVLLLALIAAWASLFLSDKVTWATVFEELGLRDYATSDVIEIRHTREAAGDIHHSHMPIPHYAAGPAPTCTPPRQPPFSAMADSGSPRRVFAFLPIAQEWSHLSLDDSCGAIDVLMPDWLTVEQTAGGFEVKTVEQDTREAVNQYLAKAPMRPDLMPVARFDTLQTPQQLVLSLSSADAQTRIASGLAQAAQGLGARGVCLQFDGLAGRESRALGRFLQVFAETLAAAGLQSCAVLGVDQNIWNTGTLPDRLDFVVLKVFQEPWTGSVPAPLAPDGWFRDTVQAAMAAIGPDRLIVAMGNYAADWVSGEPYPRILPFAQAMAQISRGGGKLSFSKTAGNSFSRFRDAEGRAHTVWMLDAASTYNQLHALNDVGVRNSAIWAMGLEDPGVWKVLNADLRSGVRPADLLSELWLEDYVDYHGTGPFLKVESLSRPGRRMFDVDTATGKIVDQRYQAMPIPYTVERFGQPETNRLVLTFDDGPNPDFTTPILDTLQQTGTPATFFVVGTSMMQAPDLVRRMVREGHEIGVHTFSHPRMDLVSHSRFEMELTAFHSLLAGVAERDTLLYREPFLRRGGPIDGRRAKSLAMAQSRGYIIAGMDIVPKDWEGWTTDKIVNHVITEVEAGTGNVILLHDGGQDRAQTVAAVPIIIRELRARGYEFTTMADVLGLDQASLMPTVTGVKPAFDRVSFSAMSFLGDAVFTVFWLVLAIGVLRSATLLILAALRRPHRTLSVGYHPSVTVVIPAYNEGSVIDDCIESVLNSQYPDIQVAVVDDGSQDDTIFRLLKHRHHPRVHVYAQPNQGKWCALNTAIRQLRSEIVICIDADTRVHPRAISRLVKHFADPKIGAVAGKVVVGNRVNLLTRLQALEYITAQGVERRAFDRINGIMVVPGAIGAWRVEAIQRAGLFSHETITEDADMTVSVNRAGYRVTYDENALAHTEAPTKVSQLLSQRLRWSLGMFQTAWKHKFALLEGRGVGLIAIPDMFLFGYLFPLLAPVADFFVLTLAYNLIAGDWTGDVGGPASSTPTHMILAYFALPCFELAIMACALMFDRAEDKRQLLLYPFQRLFYRQLLYFSVMRAMMRALTGTLAKWAKLGRSGETVMAFGDVT